MGNGRGGESIYGAKFEDENFNLKRECFCGAVLVTRLAVSIVSYTRRCLALFLASHLVWLP